MTGFLFNARSLAAAKHSAIQIEEFKTIEFFV